MTNPAVPRAVRKAFFRLRMRLESDYPGRIIVCSTPRFIPAPTITMRHTHARRLKPIWVSSYTDNGAKIVVGPFRELFDDAVNGIRELSDWYREFGRVRAPRNRPREKKWWQYEPEPQLTPEEEASRRRELAKKLFPLVKKPVRRMLFSEDVQRELMKTIDCMTHVAIRQGDIQDCKADRDDYRRSLQYACWGLASKYDESRPGNEGRSPASLVSYIKGALDSKIQDMKRTRYSLRKLGDIFTVPLEGGIVKDENGEDEFIMSLDEAEEDRRHTVHEYDENMDIGVLRAYLASPAGKTYEKAFNLLVLDGLSIREAAERMGMAYTTFKLHMLRPLRLICRDFGFAPRSEQAEAGRES